MTDLAKICDGAIVVLSHISHNHADDDLKALEEMIVVGDAIMKTIRVLTDNLRVLAEAEEIIDGVS